MKKGVSKRGEEMISNAKERDLARLFADDRKTKDHRPKADEEAYVA